MRLARRKESRMKYAIVTGGTSGMGMGVAKMLVSKRILCIHDLCGSGFYRKDK